MRFRFYLSLLFFWGLLFVGGFLFFRGLFSLKKFNSFSNQLTYKVNQDLGRLKRARKLPKEWSQIKKVTLTPGFPEIQPWVSQIKPKIKKNKNGKYALNIMVLFWADLLPPHTQLSSNHLPEASNPARRMPPPQKKISQKISQTISSENSKKNQQEVQVGVIVQYEITDITDNNLVHEFGRTFIFSTPPEAKALFKAINGKPKP